MYGRILIAQKEKNRNYFHFKKRSFCNSWEKKRYLPTNVKLCLKFRVGELKKSIRHLYTPPSVGWTFRITNFVSFKLSVNEKNNLCPRSLANDECAANCSELPFLESRLEIFFYFRKNSY